LSRHNARRRTARIGIDLESHAMPVRTFERSKAALSHVEFVDIASLPRQLRRRKSATAIAKLRDAASIGDRATRLRIGMSESVVVRSDGIERLTRLERRLFSTAERN